MPNVLFEVSNHFLCGKLIEFVRDISTEVLSGGPSILCTVRRRYIPDINFPLSTEGFDQSTPTPQYSCSLFYTRSAKEPWNEENVKCNILVMNVSKLIRHSWKFIELVIKLWEFIDGLLVWHSWWHRTFHKKLNHIETNKTQSMIDYTFYFISTSHNAVNI